MPAFENLSLRLDYLAQLALQHHTQNPYKAIYDTCCDHGYLGMYLLKQLINSQADQSLSANTELVFVDRIDAIVEQLYQPLSHFPDNTYRCLAMPLEQLRLPESGRSLVIVAGVGGTLLAKLLQRFIELNNSAEFDLLLCPSNETHSLRRYLQSTDFRLVHEAIVADKGRYYEALYLSRLPSAALNCVDEVGKMWLRENPDHHAYQQRLLAHYQRKAKTAMTPELTHIIGAYQACFD